MEIALYLLDSCIGGWIQWYNDPFELSDSNSLDPMVPSRWKQCLRLYLSCMSIDIILCPAFPVPKIWKAAGYSPYM